MMVTSSEQKEVQSIMDKVNEKENPRGHMQTVIEVRHYRRLGVVTALLIIDLISLLRTACRNYLLR